MYARIHVFARSQLTQVAVPTDLRLQIEFKLPLQARTLSNKIFHQLLSAELSSLAINGLENHQIVNRSSWFAVVRGQRLAQNVSN